MSSFSAHFRDMLEKEEDEMLPVSLIRLPHGSRVAEFSKFSRFPTRCTRSRFSVPRWTGCFGALYSCCKNACSQVCFTQIRAIGVPLNHIHITFLNEGFSQGYKTFIRPQNALFSAFATCCTVFQFLTSSLSRFCV
jgi:hypothetical protein